MDIKFWTRALREAEAELEAATTRTALNAAAKRLMRARAELKEAGAAEPTRPATDAAAQADAFGASGPLRRSQTGLLEVLDDALGELLPGIIGGVLLHDPPEEVAAAGDREPDREQELVAEAAVIHGGDVLTLFGSPVTGRAVKALALL